MRRRFVWLACGIAPWAVLSACGGSPFGGFGRTLDARITSNDTALFTGTTTTFVAVAEYDIGPGEPQTLAWTVSDNTKIRVEVVGGDALVTALDTGRVNLVARVNEDFLDTVVIDVVQPGFVRWRRSLPATPGLHPALDDSGRVHVVDLDGNLWAFDRTGDTVLASSSCTTTFGPALRTEPVSIFTTGNACMMRQDSTGMVQWTAGIGDLETAPALAIDGATVVLSLERDQAAGVVAVVLTRLSGLGVPLWRDTLVASADEPAALSAPAIATNGNIYVTWRTNAGTYHLSRYTGAGVHLWTIDLPNWARYTSPAMGGAQVAVGYNGGMAVFDTAAGGQAWSVTFPTSANVSSPIIAPDGNFYIQTLDGLYSYGPGGTLRWTADSLGAAAAGATAGIGAPTLLLTGDLIVGCQGALCAVRSADGGLAWRAPVSQVVGTAVVDLDGQIYVTSLANEVIAIWGNRLPAFNGWPTEGGDQHRTRQRL